MRNRARWLHRRFLRRARSDEGAYRDEICNRGTTKLLRKKIKQAPVGICIETAQARFAGFNADSTKIAPGNGDSIDHLPALKIADSDPESPVAENELRAVEAFQFSDQDGLT